MAGVAKRRYSLEHMGIAVFNTLSRTKESLEPLKPGKIQLFVCGPTVYDWAHIGHAKTYTQFDFIARYLRWRGFEVEYLQNITDIDDKIIDRSAREHISVEDLVRVYEERYREDMAALGNTSVTKYARASSHIDTIVSQVQRLLASGHAYELPDGYYFDISAFSGYGKLSRRQHAAADDAVSRVDENPLKRQPGDFALWKRRKPDEPYWVTPLGEGRPGWHIEDTAITEDYFGPQYDAHGGAVDLIFPHHEAEIAQMESISHRAPLAKYWIHTGFLNINATKMSKSLGNAFTIRSMLKRVSARHLRFFMLSYHYRSPIDYADEILDKAGGGLRRIDNFYERLGEEDAGSSPEVDETRRRITDALDNDFDTPSALAVLFEFIRSQHRSNRSARGSRILLEDLDALFGFLPAPQGSAARPVGEIVEKAIAERQKLREEKQYAKADAIRDSLKSEGIELEDTSAGVHWYRVDTSATRR